MHTYLSLDIHVKFANRCNVLKWISYGIRAISPEINFTWHCEWGHETMES